jgi:hypothetical protein
MIATITIMRFIRYDMATSNWTNMIMNEEFFVLISQNYERCNFGNYTIKLYNYLKDDF